MSDLIYTVYISCEPEAGPNQWDAVVNRDDGRMIARSLGASPYDIAAGIAKIIDKEAGNQKEAGDQAKADRVRDQLSKLFG